MKRKISAILLLSLLTSLSACGSQSTSQGDTDAPTDASTSIIQAEEYSYPALDMKGEAYHVLNMEPIWYYYMQFNSDEITGDPLDDMLYTRNRFIEQQFNTEIVEHAVHIDELSNILRSSILAGDDEYDVAYILGANANGILTPEFLTKLDGVDELALDKPWWDQHIGAQNIGETYFAMSYSTLTGFDSSTCVFFNQKVFEDYKLDSPYKLVKDGKWTLDMLGKYAAETANLNGDASFALDLDGNSRYGLLTWNNGLMALMIGCDARIVRLVNGEPTFEADGEHYQNSADKVVSVTSLDCFLDTTTAKSDLSHEELFERGRGTLLIAQLKSSSLLRQMEDDYGVLPMPKFDESQENYLTYAHGCPVLFPITNQNLSETAIITDAIAYYSYKNLLPLYYDSVLKQKQMRDEDSIAMLEMVRESITYDIAYIHKWVTNLNNRIMSTITKGDSTISSLIASEKSAIEASIKTTLELYKES